MGLGQGGGLLNRWVKEVTVKTPPVELLMYGLLSDKISNYLLDVVEHLEASSVIFTPEVGGKKRKQGQKISKCCPINKTEMN